MLIDMKDKKHVALEPMKQPRRQVWAFNIKNIIFLTKYTVLAKNYWKLIGFFNYYRNINILEVRVYDSQLQL
jgi:hypothetical protein